MELFSLLAKLTLDKREFDSAVKEAEEEAKGITVDEPSLGLDKNDFDTGIDEANSAEVDDLDDPELGIEKEHFDTGIEEANDAVVDNPDEPTLGLDKTEFDDNIAEAEATGGLFSSSLKDIFNELSGVLVASGIAATVAGIVGSLKEGVELVKNTGDAIHKQSSFIGLTTDAYQELDYALGLSGTSLSEFARGFKSFQQMAAGEVTDKQAEAFKALGIEAEKAADSQDLMFQSLYALADYTEGDRDIIAKALFGNNYNKLSRLLEAGSEGIKQMQEEAHGLGFVMSEEEIQNAADYMDATTRLEKSIEGLKTSLVKEIIPFLTDVSNTIAEVVSALNPRSTKPTLQTQLENIDTALAGTVQSLEHNEEKAQTLLDKLIELGEYNSLDEKGKKTWDELAKELIELFPKLDEVINTDTHTIKGNTDEIKENIKQWTLLEEKRLIDESLAEKKQAIAKKYAEALEKEVEAEVAEADALSYRKESIEELNQYIQEQIDKHEQLAKSYDDSLDTGMADVERKRADRYRQYLLDENASLEEFSENRAALLSDIDEQNDADTFNKLLGIGGEWIYGLNAAQGMREEAEKLTKEADEASETYSKYAEKLAEKLGITTEETTKARDEIVNYIRELKKVPSDVYTTIHQAYQVEGYTHAIGASYIPFDNYPALLHRGEKVLTATEARRSDIADIDYTKLEDKIVEAIRVGMADANVTAVVTDRQVARGSNRYNGNEMDARRFRP